MTILLCFTSNNSRDQYSYRVLEALGINGEMMEMDEVGDMASVWSAEAYELEPIDREEIAKSQKVQFMKLRVQEKTSIVKALEQQVAKYKKQIEELTKTINV